MSTVVQSHIIQYAIESLLTKLAAVGDAEVRLWVPNGQLDPGEQDLLLVSLQGVREQREQNVMQRIRRTGVDEEGHKIEYFSRPATMLRLEFAVAPLNQDPIAAFAAYGDLVQYLKDNSHSPVGAYDWAGNEGRDIVWEVGAMETAANTSMWDVPGVQPGAVIGVAAEVGIDSAMKEGFTRVRERRMSAIKKGSETE